MQLASKTYLAGDCQVGCGLAAESAELSALANHAPLDHAAVALKTAVLHLF